ncbi:MAG: MarR family transcriptional regulator [Tissierellia bacterium]|nr:MarR family transcriptional regulator [Tissierellia bacterium]
MIRENKEERLHQLLRELHHKNFSELKKYAPKNTTPGLVPLLRFIQDCPQITQKELSDKMYVSKAALGQWLISLEKDNYLERKINVQDRREKFIFLTPKGERLLEENQIITQRLYRKLFLPLSDEELLLLEKLMAKITGEFDD